MKFRHYILLPLLAVLCSLSIACGGAEEAPRGEVFCESYENSFMGTCRQNCEAANEEGDKESVGKACEGKCTDDLKDDDTFSSDCGARVREL